MDTRQPKRPRMAFLESEGINSMNNTIRLEKDRGDTCETKKIYLRVSNSYLGTSNNVNEKIDAFKYQPEMVFKCTYIYELIL